jgi:phosphoglycolate phosphatase
MLPNKAPHKIIFDFDNTLVDTMPVIYKAFNHTLNTFNLPSWSVTELQNRVKFSPRDFLPTLVGEENAEKASAVFLEHYQKCKENILPLPGAEKLLKFCKSCGIKLYIISNKRGYVLRDEVENLDWQPYFENIVGSEDFIHDKPHPRIVEYTIGELGRKDIWFVGDSDVDIKCGVESGCYSILVNNMENSSFSSIPDISFANLEVFLDAIKSVI